MTRRTIVILSSVSLLMGMLTTSVSAAPTASGARALSGADAAAFQLPADLVQVWQATYPDGTVQTRYQQMVGDARVLGGQLTVITDAAGTVRAVIGAHYPGLRATNANAITPEQARGVAEASVGAAGRWVVSTLINPSDGRLFYLVENRRVTTRWIHWVDASTGKVLRAYDAIAYDGPGIGVKGDTKTLDTSVQGATNVLVTSDGRQETHDAANTQFSSGLPGILFADADDTWNLAGRQSPGQPAGVDAHYYAGVVDDFYGAVFGRNSLDDAGMTMISSAHFGRNYNNAFWNGIQMVYGDGDGRRTFRELSGGLDVVGHEFTHGVTEFTSNLIYANESGALNEAFSDMMGNTIEFYAAAGGLDPTVTPDWFIGEDVYIPADDDPGFRNMSDPQEDGDPDHYSERFLGSSDGGGVHTNSAIPNHAYYLAVNGGQNAGCDAVGSDGHQHTADCDVVVDAIGLADARETFYLGFTSLPENANMCDARNATVAAAAGPDRFNVSDAWAAVGIHEGCTGAPPILPCDFTDVTIPFESLHPYETNRDCSWVYDNGTANFALHFSLLDVEKNFDYVRILDGNGTELISYTGTFHRGVTTPCIGTSSVKVVLDTDPAVVGQGFIVDAVVACP
jgi:bacillolysin